MNTALQKLICQMLDKHIIGAKHIPEELLFKRFTRHLPRDEQKAFFDEYEKLQEHFIRLKKRTGRGSEWHISIQPKSISKLQNME